MPDANVVVWTTDWHIVSNNEESAETGTPTTPAKAAAVVQHINETVDPIGCFDLGDNKDHYGTVGTTDEHDNYITYVGNVLRWMQVNAGFNAQYPTLPGNHDELYDYTNTPPSGNNDFSTTFDTKFWGAPYHWTTDWNAPKIRFIAVHSYIHHQSTGSPDAPGFFHVDTAESTWVEQQIDALPDNWQAIVCTHAPLPNAFGNYVRYDGSSYHYGINPDSNFMAMLETHTDRIACCLSGHRHLNWITTTARGLTHISSGGMSYGANNGRGTFVKMTYEPSGRTITFDCRYATSPYERFGGLSPLTISLPDVASSMVYGVTFVDGRPTFVQVRPN